jgi:membrane-bound lytic murein transglycosylase D
LYVAKFFAFTHLAGYAPRFGLEQLPGVNNGNEPVSWDRIPLNQAVDLRLLSAQSGIPLSTLTDANAELRYGITPPADAGYFLKVPAEFSDTIRRVLADNDKPLLRFYLHEIKSGDTFYGLSRHFGVPVSMIESYNPSAGARSLRSGQKIIIPALKETGPYRDASSFAERWLQSRPYKVKPGDTLWSIAESSGTTAEELAFNNGLPEGGVLRAGITIQIPGENN